MDVDRIQDKGSPITVSLPEVFVNLFTTSSGKSEDKEVPDPEALLKMKEHTRDVENIIAENQDLVIKGEAGSGKTTLLKHFVYMCFKQPGWKGMNEVLPVLVFLKDLKEFPWKNRPQNEETAEALLRHSFRETGCGLDMETVRQYCSAGKALFLLDGLDEIEIELRNLVVNSLTCYRRVCKGGRFVFSGRPHGVDGDVVNRFSNQTITILPFTMDQVNTFIDKWFRGMKQSSANQVTKTAEEMISEVQDNPGIEKLIYNPLMLTAVCILYFDQKELPGQRAELYKKFVENMLHRGKRFKDPERIHSFLMALAYANHIKKRKGCDRNTALTILEEIYPKKKQTGIEYRIFLQKTFERIEPDCGLLKFDAGQLIFRHLTFQEFLTAEYIKDREKQYDQVIRNFWEDEWYKEVVELLIGLLSIDSRQWANDMVKGALTLSDKPPYLRFRLGARSILDIHADRRDHHVVDLAMEKMREIIVSGAAPKERADAGEILGRLGDRRALEKFIRIPDGKYETSVGKVVLKDFHMAQYPVTNQWFKKFIKDGGYENHSFWSPEGLKWLEHTGAKQPRLWHDRSWNCPNHPVVAVCWWEADAFCRWLTTVKDDGCFYCLPTEKQWEATAAGLKKREYPWGKKFDADRCNTEETKIGNTSAVGIFKDGETPESVAELAGNVLEWTGTSYHRKSDLMDFPFELDAQELYEKIISTTGDEWKKLVEDYFQLSEDQKRQFPVLRGGSWGGVSGFARCSYRNFIHPYDRYFDVGFRCSRIKR
jgi:formylglycine-generating enzyme required for sulfatase activity/energy-coupling factor transporter ATP-binding protein EcfA2